jgi:anti-sigma factor RsiW
MSENILPSQLPHPDDIQLNEYLDGYLVDDQIMALKLHLESCPQCTTRLDELRSVFVSLEMLPDLPLERELSSEVVAAIQPKWKLSQRWIWGALAQFILAVIVILWAVPSRLKTWWPLIMEMQLALSTQLSERWLALLTTWSTKLTEFQLIWPDLFTEWQPPALLETTQILVWPAFLAAILLFVVGNGLLLRKITRNGYH